VVSNRWLTGYIYQRVSQSDVKSLTQFVRIVDCSVIDHKNSSMHWPLSCQCWCITHGQAHTLSSCAPVPTAIPLRHSLLFVRSIVKANNAIGSSSYCINCNKFLILLY